jgi:hypothetical protein
MENKVEGGHGIRRAHLRASSVTNRAHFPTFFENVATGDTF